MVARSLCLSLCLLVLSCTCGGAPAGAAPLPDTFEAKLALSPSSDSFLPIDVGALAQWQCDPNREQIHPHEMAKCHLVASNSSGGNTSGILINLHGNGIATINSLEILSTVDTTCGIWDVSLTPDPNLPPRESALVFEEDPEDPGRGVFSGVVEADTILHLANRETGETADYPLSLGLGLAGPWIAAPPESSGPPLLFAERRDGEILRSSTCLPAWAVRTPKDLETFIAQGCPICWYPDLTVEEHSGGAGQ